MASHKMDTHPNLQCGDCIPAIKRSKMSSRPTARPLESSWPPLELSPHTALEPDLNDSHASHYAMVNRGKHAACPSSGAKGSIESPETTLQQLNGKMSPQGIADAAHAHGRMHIAVAIGIPGAYWPHKGQHRLQWQYCRQRCSLSLQATLLRLLLRQKLRRFGCLPQLLKVLRSTDSKLLFHRTMSGWGYERSVQEQQRLD